jgi:hypothetical protein
MFGAYELIRKYEIDVPYNTFPCVDVFSDDYDTYAITVNLPNNVSNSNVYMRLYDASGNSLTDTNYDSHNKSLNLSGATDIIYSGTLSYWERPFANSGDDGNGGLMYIYNPYSTTYPTFGASQSISHHTSTSNFNYTRGTYRRRTVERNTGFSLSRATSPRTFQGVISVFGVK